MFAAPPITVPSKQPPGGGASARAMIEAQLAMLAELAEIGMELARAAGRRASAEGGENGADGSDPALSYARAARAVRLTFALQSKLMKDLGALDGAAAQARAADAGKRRDRIHRRVEQIIEGESSDADEAEALSSLVWERLTDADESALLDRPIAEVVAQICQDLGLSPASATPYLTDLDFTPPDATAPAGFGQDPFVPPIPTRASAPVSGLNSS